MADREKTLNLIRLSLKEECAIDPAAVREDVHLLNDLDIDSLDLLNASFRIEKECGVNLPVQDWIGIEYGEVAPRVSPFLVKQVAAYIEARI